MELLLGIGNMGQGFLMDLGSWRKVLDICFAL